MPKELIETMTTKRAHKQWQLHKKQNFLEKELETLLDRFYLPKEDIWQTDQWFY